MRPLGKIHDEQLAQAFCDLLYLEGIGSEFDEEDGTIWIEDEDQMEAAQREYASFKVAPPTEARRVELHLESESKREQAYMEDERAAAMQKSSKDVFKNLRGGGIGGMLRNKPGPLTLGLLGFSVLVTLASAFGKAGWCLEWMYIAELERVLEGYRYMPKFDDLLGGQFWRALTPIFIHLDPLHLLFNMWWLYDLGSMIERRKGWPMLLALVIVAGIAPNLLQAAIDGPVFGGMSGAVFGLLGYVWILGERSSDSDLKLHPMIPIFMGGWLLLGFVLPQMGMANWCHLGGLLVGVAFAFGELAFRGAR